MSVHEQFAEDLALHALGTLSGDQRSALEQHLETCASCRRELELLRGDIAVIALSASGPRPPARSRERLMSAIAREPRLAAPTRAPGAAAPETPRRLFVGWGALGWAAALGLLLVAIALMRQNSSFEREIASLKARFGEQESKLQQANDVVAALVDPESQKVELVAAGKKPEPRGKAIYQRRNRSLIFFASNLPPLPAEKIYELWLFPADGGAPIAAGLFKPDPHGSATLVNPPLPEGVQAKNFVVTLEPESGSHEAPRGTPVIVGLGG
jgi:anti-sigma-K factor RskA